MVESLPTKVRHEFCRSDAPHNGGVNISMGSKGLNERIQASNVVTENEERMFETGKKEVSSFDRPYSLVVSSDWLEPARSELERSME